MSAEFKRFAERLADLDLFEKVFPVLIENGFDDWEAVSYLSIDALKEIGKILFQS